jgi:hypothetical protein
MDMYGIDMKYLMGIVGKRGRDIIRNTYIWGSSRCRK